ncbi:hypothetical protein BDV96DRAFT_178028 [Lophiotrema nucula]|uniref:Uncharacterized protein n=1 Tax=Lophiotrema nucula TaxID=690887 RepID=A0A6A5YXC8_9PLEO|nr:hypothetical protein BDV96DRAFT_178028 [Lophiotrema nucula]
MPLCRRVSERLHKILRRNSTSKSISDPKPNSTATSASASDTPPRRPPPTQQHGTFHSTTTVLSTCPRTGENPCRCQYSTYEDKEVSRPKIAHPDARFSLRDNERKGRRPSLDRLGSRGRAEHLMSLQRVEEGDEGEDDQLKGYTEQSERVDSLDPSKVALPDSDDDGLGDVETIDGTNDDDEAIHTAPSHPSRSSSSSTPSITSDSTLVDPETFGAPHTWIRTPHPPPFRASTSSDSDNTLVDAEDYGAPQTWISTSCSWRDSWTQVRRPLSSRQAAVQVEIREGAEVGSKKSGDGDGDGDGERKSGLRDVGTVGRWRPQRRST